MANLSALNTNFFSIASETFEDNLSASIAAGAAIVAVSNASEYTDGDIAALTVDPGTTAEATFIGKKSGNTFIECVWTEGNTAVGHTLGASIIDYDSATHHNAMTKGLLKVLNQDGSLKTQPIRDALGIGTSSTDGYSIFPGALTTGTGSNNGNKEFITTAANYDARGVVNSGTKVRVQRAVAPPTQSMSFTAASAQYATRATPTGITPTTTFTCEAWIYLNSYTGTQHIISRGDNGATGGFAIRVNTAGTLSVYYGTGGTFTEISTVEAIPLKRMVHVAAVINSTTTKSGTVYINGRPAILFYIASNAASLTNVGNLTIGSIATGAANTYFDGVISEARIWSTARTQNEVRDNMGISLTGSETGLIALFQGNGNFNDKTSNANNLTASGGAIATYADNPYHLYEYGKVTNVSYSSPNSTITIFCGTDYVLPNAAIAGVYYSNVSAPTGFPTSEEKWMVDYIVQYEYVYVIAASGTYYNALEVLRLPTGSWKLDIGGIGQATGTVGAALEGDIGFSTSSTINTGASTNAGTLVDFHVYQPTAATVAYVNMASHHDLTVPTPAIIYMWMMQSSGNGTYSMRLRGNITPFYMRAKLAV